MTKDKFPARQGPRYIFYFLMLAILGWFIFMQFFGADERTVSKNSPSLLYPGTFTWEKSDGTTEEIPVPMMFPQAKPWSSHLPFRQILMPHL